MKSQPDLHQLLIRVTAAGVVAGLAIIVVTGEPPGADIVLPDSPLYNLAVTESIKGLTGEKDEPAAEPCPDCGEVHAPANGSPANLAHSAPGVSTNFAYCDNCKVYHPVTQPVQFTSP